MRTRHLLALVLLLASFGSKAQYTSYLKLKQLQKASGQNYHVLSDAYGNATWVPYAELDPIFTAHPSYSWTLNTFVRNQFTTAQSCNAWINGWFRADSGFKVNNNIVWHQGNDGQGSGLDADIWGGATANFNSVANVISQLVVKEGAVVKTANSDSVKSWLGLTNAVINEIDPTVPSYVKSITSTEKSNWNTAYGWGNHALAGYLTSSDRVLSFDTGTRSLSISGIGGNSVVIPAGGSGGGGSTNLSVGTRTSTTVDVNSSTGSGATLPSATATQAGVYPASDVVKVAGIDSAKSNIRGTISNVIASLIDTAAQIRADFPSGSAYDSTVMATRHRNDTGNTNIRASIAGKEDAFVKGDIIQGSGVSITGTLTNRLVGSGNITISATGSAGYVQWSDTSGQLPTTYRLDTTRARINTDLNSKIAKTHTVNSIVNGSGFLKNNGSGTWSYDNSNYVPTSRTITINGVTYDLSSNRSWTISGADSAIYATLYRLDTAKTALRSAIATKGSGTVTSVGISSTDLSISGSPITTSGSITVNINNGAVTDSKIRNSAGLSVIGRSVNTTGQVADIIAGIDNQVLRRSGTNIGFGAVRLDDQNAITGYLSPSNGGTGVGTLSGVVIGRGISSMEAVSGTASQLLRRNAANTAYEFFTPSYITGNQTITLSGDVTGSGTTSISTVIPSSTITYAKMQGVNGSKLLGRYNTYSGTVQEVSLGSGLSFDTSSGTLSATGGGGSPTLTENYIGFGNSSNLLTGDSSLTFNGSQVVLVKPSGAPEYFLGRGWDNSLYGRFIIPTSNLSYTGADFKDMPVLFGSSPGLGLVSGDNGIKINSTASGGIEFWAGYGQKLKLSNAGVRLPTLATYGGAKMVTADYNGDLATVDIVPVAGAVYTPTATLGSDVSSHTLGKAMYQRVGDVIDVSITGSITTTGSTAAWVEFTLPISSNLNNTYDLIGQGVIHSSSKSSVLVVEGNASADRAKVTIKNDISGNILANGTYDYTINFKYIRQ